MIGRSSLSTALAIAPDAAFGIPSNVAIPAQKDRNSRRDTP